jgi:uncharacterized protein (TIGR03083 family)
VSATRTGNERLPRALAYRHIRRNVTDLLGQRPQAGAVRVPAYRGCAVLDLVAHLVRNCRLAECNLLGGWVRPQGADDLDGSDLSALLAEWAGSARRVEQELRPVSHGKTGSVLVMDAFSHELDIDSALGVPFPADHPALPWAFEVAVDGFNAAVGWRGLPALRLEADARCWTAGEGEPAASVAGAWLDLYRALTGRRTVEQIRALQWSADPEPYLPAFSWGPFRPPAAPVE